MGYLTIVLLGARMKDNEWTDADKALWILENGEPDIKWIYERNGTLLYKRPLQDAELPPWIPLTKEFFKELKNKDK